jgi:hypothetical protein
MSIVDDLVSNLVERNAIRVRGALTVRLLDGGIRVSGTLASSLQDQKRNKDVLHVTVPVTADVKVADIVVPVPNVP